MSSKAKDNGKCKINRATVIELQAHVASTKTATDPIVLTASTLAQTAVTSNADIHTLSQIKVKTVRLNKRLHLVRENRLALMAADPT